MNTIVDESIATGVAKLLLQIKAVSINVHKPFRYVSGLLAPLYTDNRLLISHPHEWNKVLRYYQKVIQSTIGLAKVDVLSGTATAAIPHAAALASSMNLPMVYVRTSKKDHGKENLIEGEFAPKSKVLIIEDLVSTGSSVEHNVKTIREAGGIVTQCLAITTSTVHAYEKTVDELHIQLSTLTNIQTVIDVAKKIGQINDKEYESIQEFLKDPSNWAKNNGLA